VIDLSRSGERNDDEAPHANRRTFPTRRSSDLKNAGQRVVGNIKEKAGDLTNDESLEAEGRREQSEADVKDAGENIKDGARARPLPFRRRPSSPH